MIVTRPTKPLISVVLTVALLLVAGAATAEAGNGNGKGKGPGKDKSDPTSGMATAPYWFAYGFGNCTRYELGAFASCTRATGTGDKSGELTGDAVTNEGGGRFWGGGGAVANERIRTSGPLVVNATFLVEQATTNIDPTAPQASSSVYLAVLVFPPGCRESACSFRTNTYVAETRAGSTLPATLENQTFTVSVTVPDGPSGNYLLYALGQATAHTGTTFNARSVSAGGQTVTIHPALAHTLPSPLGGAAASFSATVTNITWSPA